jgi:AraC family transcriptional regulator
MTTTGIDQPLPTPPAPRFAERGPFMLAGIREHHAFDGPFAEAIGAQWDRLVPHLDAIPSRARDADYGASFGAADGSVAGFDYLCGVEIAGAGEPGGLPDGFVVARVPARRWAVFAHPGPIDELRHTIDAVFSQWLPASGFALAAEEGAPDMLERYGAGFDPAAGRGDLEVWVPCAQPEPARQDSSAGAVGGQGGPATPSRRSRKSGCGPPSSHESTSIRATAW